MLSVAAQHAQVGVFVAAAAAGGLGLHSKPLFRGKPRFVCKSVPMLAESVLKKKTFH